MCQRIARRREIPGNDEPPLAHCVRVSAEADQNADHGGRRADPALDRLAERVRAGDRAALEELLRALLPRVRRWLTRLLGPRADVDDATQDLLVELARALPRFDGRAACATYCYRITLRVASRYYGRRRPISLELVAPPADTVDPESRVLRRELLTRLYAELDRLPADLRSAFVLCRVEGLAPAEAAAICDVSPGTLRVRLHRARRRVERALERDPYVARAGRRREGSR